MNAIAKICWLVLLVIACIPSGFAEKPGPASEKQPAQQEQPVQEEVARDVFESNITALDVPVSTAQPVAINVHFEGISIGPAGAAALINGIVYHKGEQKAGIKVIQIRKREVDILINGVPRTLRTTPGQGAATSKTDEKTETLPERNGIKITSDPPK